MSVEKWIRAIENIQYDRAIEKVIDKKEHNGVIRSSLKAFLQSPGWKNIGSFLLMESGRTFVFGENNLTNGRIWSPEKFIYHLDHKGVIAKIKGTGPSAIKKGATVTEMIKTVLKRKDVEPNYNPVKEINRYLDWLAEKYI